jgi:hypothetical protein
MKVKHQHIYWVVRRGDAYFNTYTTDFYNKKTVDAKSNDFNNAFRFPSLGRVLEFTSCHKCFQKDDIVKVVEDVLVSYKMKKVTK